ncbi:hypothetical protein CHS0354_015268 [Potamilus streckersoni]|uniref:Uncharacterized protein n=1 Tax=Potamilus streckersoni TaxID=2493646 RepID=A0AAE0VJ79_9BIVA|nr:hypothetical protein CHS0354_015268 [Potamilus streckersoni]
MSNTEAKPSPQTTQVVQNGPSSRYVDYKPKPYNPKYKEYRSTYEMPKYKPFVPTQLEFKGNVEYKLTKENYYPLKHWKTKSMNDPVSSKQSKVDTTKKEEPFIPPKAVTPPPPQKTPTPTPPPPKPPATEPTPRISPPMPTQEFKSENKYPAEVIACVQAYLMAHRHAPNKEVPRNYVNTSVLASMQRAMNMLS